MNKHLLLGIILMPFFVSLIYGLLMYAISFNDSLRDKLVTQVARAEVPPWVVPLPFVKDVDKSNPQEYIAAMFKLGLWVSGVLAMGVIVVSGVLYMLAVGNPSQQSDAVDRIKMALLGLLILALTYIILNTINPQLVQLQAPKPS